MFHCCKEKTTERQKPKCGAQRRAEQHEETKNTLTGIERHEQQGRGECQRKEQVQNSADAAISPTECPQQVVEQTKPQPQNAGYGKLKRLQRNRQFHYRNSREKKPAFSRPSSS